MNKIKVKLLRPIFPYASGEIIEMEEKKVNYFRNQIEIIEETKEKTKEVKTKENKAIQSNKNTKWL